MVIASNWLAWSAIRLILTQGMTQYLSIGRPLDRPRDVFYIKALVLELLECV